jgi:pyridoxamine 5'-phosphate oxidase
MNALDPIARFSSWLEDAKRTSLEEPFSMVVSSVDARGRPSSRVVLLRGLDERGFVFYTNFHSRKGQELLAHPFAALNFHWMPLKRQVRVEGEVERVTEAEADAYFASRARESQLSSWASAQSEVLPSEDTFGARIAQMEARFHGQTVPRPPHWSGLRVKPDRIELWEERAFRRHHRELYTKTSDGWRFDLLYP